MKNVSFGQNVSKRSERFVGRTDMFGRISSERHVRSYKLGQTHFVRAQLIMKYLTNFRLEYKNKHSCRNAISDQLHFSIDITSEKKEEIIILKSSS